VLLVPRVLLFVREDQHIRLLLKKKQLSFQCRADFFYSDELILTVYFTFTLTLLVDHGFQNYMNFGEMLISRFWRVRISRHLIFCEISQSLYDKSLKFCDFVMELRSSIVSFAIVCCLSLYFTKPSLF